MKKTDAQTKPGVEFMAGKSYAEIWKWFEARVTGPGKLDYHAARAIHLKWKRIAAES